MVRHKGGLLNIFVRYKDTSDDEGDIALTKLKMPCDTHQRPTLDFEFEKHCQLFGTDNETLSAAKRISDDGPWFAAATKANFLKQAEQFEDDYDNNNYSDYVEDASVHALTDISLGLRWRAFMRANRRRWHWKTAGVASRRSFIQGTITKRLGCPLAKLSSAAFLAAAFLTATSLLATTALFFALALLAATALFVTITLFVAIALLAATALLAAFLSGSRRFDRFVRIALCFHSTFLYFSY
jgi:hypothetical protein